MIRISSLFALLGCGYLGGFCPTVLSGAVAPSQSSQTGITSVETMTFAKHLKPFFAEYCFSCHGKEKKKAGVNLEVFGDNTVILADRKIWETVLDMLESREMPPEKKPQPSEEQRQSIIQFIDSELAKLDCNGPINPGKVTIRRLNRNEYNNTIRDLVGIDFKPAADFPSDEVGYGFDNIGDVLSLPPILMEKYLAAAEQIVTRAIVADSPWNSLVKRIEAETLPSTANGGIFEDRALSLDTEGEAYTEFPFPQKGDYIIRARAFGQQAGPDPARMAFRLGGKELKVVDVPTVESHPGIYEVRARIESGTQRLAVAYINNYNVSDHPDPKLRGDRNLIVDYIEVEGPIGAEPQPLPEAHSRIIPRHPAPGTERAFAKEILGKFARRAYRRPVRGDELERLVRFIDIADAEKGTFEEGIQLALQAILTSPHFLYRWELDPKPENPGTIRPLSDYEIASRLSYFIWSSMPDEELFSQAERGALTKRATLQAEVERMLQDTKAKALVDNFASQWLTIRNLEIAAPDPDLFPDFDEKLRTAMRKETELFFEAIMREDRSVLEFLDSNFTFLNERLARHYGIEGVRGEQFQRVSLNKANGRGGILTQASVLTITSNPTRTSPVSRGKWILEQILGAPPPPPPPDVPQFAENQKAIQGGSLRQRLEQHRSNPDCAVCHNKMDPLGFAFENFDAIGAWRSLDGKFPIDASGKLPTGQTFSGADELKAILKSQGTFVRSLAEKMLTFALGRGLEYYDKCAVDDICKALVKNDCKFSSLITEIVKSEPFLMRKKEGDSK